MRDLAPAADRRSLQEAVTRPFEGLLDVIASEGHFLAYEDWTGEFADDNLTEEDYRRALNPAFGAIEVARGLIEVRLDEPARLAFELGELLDQGVRPPGIYRFLLRPRPSSGQTEGELICESVRSGEVPPDVGWYEDIRQMLIELARGLGLPPDRFLLERTSEEVVMGALINQLVEGIEAALIASQILRRRSKDETNQNSPMFEASNDSILPTLNLAATLEDDAAQYVGAAVQGITELQHIVLGSYDTWDTTRLSFDFGTRTVTFDGVEFLIKRPDVYKAFELIYQATCEGQEVKGSRLKLGRPDRLLRKWLPPELWALIRSQSGPGGGYILSIPRKSP